jgi:multicomponent Na+:H+ antiporter subunit F
MNAQDLLALSLNGALLILSAALVLCVWRVIRGPSLPDRVLALDMLVAVAIGYIAVIGIRTGYALYVDIAIALGLVGFLATVAFARFILAGAARDKHSVRSDIERDRNPPLEAQKNEGAAS